MADAIAEDVYFCRDAAVEGLHTTPEGFTELFRLLLPPGADVAALVQELGLGEVLRLISRASGLPPLNLPSLFTQTFTDAGLLPAARTNMHGSDWVEIDRKLFEQFGILPHQVDDMTIPELQALYPVDEAVTLDLALERKQLMQRLSVEQKLRFAYRKWQC